MEVKTMKRSLTVIALLLTLCLVASFVPFMSNAEEATKSEGLKLVNGNYVIENAADLATFVALVNAGNNFAGKTVYMTADIQWNDTTNFASWTASTTGLNPWTPIGSWGKEFKGTFDGQGHTLSGLWAAPTVQNFGVFGVTDNTTIKNLKITDSKFFLSKGNCGGLIGIHREFALNVENVYNDIDITVSGTETAQGGFVGLLHGNGQLSPTKHNLTFKNSVYAGTFTSPNNYVGGFIGSMQCTNANTATKPMLWNIVFTDCLVSGDVTGKAAVGGYIGSHPAFATSLGAGLDSITITMTDCMLTGKVTEATGGWGNIGNLTAGLSCASNASAITNVWYLDNLGKDCAFKDIKNRDGSDIRAALEAGATEKAATDFEALTNTTLTSAGFENWGKTANGVMPKMAFAEADLTEPTIPVVEVKPAADASKYAGTKSTALRTEGNNVYIDSAADLAFFADAVTNGTDYAGKTVLLTKDIIWNEGDASRWSATDNAPKYTWSCGAWGNRFKGTFDGQGHVISGLFLSSTVDNVGFFNAVDGTVTVKNLAIVNSSFSTTKATANLGGIFGVVGDAATATIDNVFVDAYCVALNGDNVGGLIGRIHMGNVKPTITNSVFAGVVVGKSNVGGLIGNAVINGATNGLTASSKIVITDCANYGLVFGNSNVSQIVGKNENGTTTLTNVIAAGRANNGEAPAFFGDGRQNVTLVNCLMLAGSSNAASGVAGTTELTGFAEVKEATLLGKVPTGYTNWVAYAEKNPLPTALKEALWPTPVEDDKDDKNPNKNPGTSDWAAPSMILAVMAVATGAAVVLRKKVSE